jgi:hypothetical protein
LPDHEYRNGQQPSLRGAMNDGYLLNRPTCTLEHPYTHGQALVASIDCNREEVPQRGQKWPLLVIEPCLLVLTSSILLAFGASLAFLSAFSL